MLKSELCCVFLLKIYDSLHTSPNKSQTPSHALMQSTFLIISASLQSVPSVLADLYFKYVQHILPQGTFWTSSRLLCPWRATWHTPLLSGFCSYDADVRCPHLLHGATTLTLSFSLLMTNRFGLVSQYISDWLTFSLQWKLLKKRILWLT